MVVAMPDPTPIPVKTKLVRIRNNLNELSQILEIDRLCKEYLQGIDQLILIPHRDIHLLPLHALFPENLTITYLPSAQIGLDLQQKEATIGDRILCVEDPVVDFDDTSIKEIAPLPHAKREIDGISYIYGTNNLLRLTSEVATKFAVIKVLETQEYNCFHFTGHGFHNVENPLQSALYLSNKDQLTLKDIFELNLQHHSLVCLSACETGITKSQAIIDEYVGLVSGFLAAGATYVISTLWTVDDMSSSLLMIQFHQFLRKERLCPALALAKAQKWLKKLTHQTLSEWYRDLGDELDTIDQGCSSAEHFWDLAREAQTTFENTGRIDPLYAHPYYWAGFTITGRVPGGSSC
jgi:CHAT domain-containing protein